MQNPSFVNTLIETVAAHTELSVLQDLAASMRGKYPPDVIAFVERKISTALIRVEQVDAALPEAVDRAVWDGQRAAASKNAH